MRPELLPDLVTAEQRYPEILRLILGYTEYVDAHGDARGIEHARMAARVAEVTDKDPARFDLVHWWEAEGADVLAFRLSLPDPPTIELTRSDLVDVVERILDAPAPTGPGFAEIFAPYLVQWFHDLLRRNCRRYRPELFHRRREPDGSGRDPELTEIVEALVAGDRR